MGLLHHRRAGRLLHAGLIALLAAILPACTYQSPLPPFELADGDLLFQDLDGHPLCDAIEAVTWGCEGAKFSHVGIFALDSQGNPTVIEASGRVKTTPLDKFLSRSRKVVVGRVMREYAAFIPAALAKARDLLGEPYDDVFLLDNGKYYCSELVYEVFRDANTDKPMFEVQPMTFCPPGSTQPMKIWKEYFQAKGVPIPEGKLGCNPGGISRSQKIVIMYVFDKPTGWSAEAYRKYKYARREYD